MKLSFASRVRIVLSMVKHNSDYTNGISYYPECNHKTKIQILKDQIYFFWKYGFIEEYYYTYGFDRVEMTREKMEEYIVPYRAFLNRIDYLNSQNPYFDAFLGKMTCRVINQDKFYFFLFLSRLGVPTPKVYCFIKDKKILYLDDAMKVDRSRPEREQIMELLSYEMDVFAKPSDGMMGQGVFRLHIKDSKTYMDGVEQNADTVVDALLSADYILQETIVQHEKMSALCSSSVNTIRLQTVMDKDGNVIPFGPGVRIGRMGNIVDNWAKGGVFVGIDSSTEKLKKIGIMKPKYGTKVSEHPDSHIPFEGYPIPYYKEAEKMVVDLHKMMYRSHSIGWDIAITENGPVIIEGNDRWEITLIQAVHGGMGYLNKYFYFD